MKKTLLSLLLLCSTVAAAAPRIGHHGDWVVKCHPPKFFWEKPADGSKIAEFQSYEFSASENTDIKTLKVWVNNEVQKVSVEQQPSGHYRIAGRLRTPLREGKAWLKVTSESNDGCNSLRAWNVYLGK